MKLIELLDEKYLYPKGKSLKPGFMKMTKDMDKLFKYSKNFDKFETEFRKKYPDYPDDITANNELKDLWDLYKSVQEALTKKIDEGKIVNNIDLDDYANSFQNIIYKKWKGKNIMGWELSTDDMSGAFYWDKKGSPVTVIATPFWNGEEKLPVDIQDTDTGDYKSQKSYPLKFTGDPRKDEKEFLTILGKVFKSMKP